MKKMQSSPTVSTLSKEEMKSRALAFAKNWVGPQREEAEAKTFIDDFFEIFGRDRRSVDAQFEHHVPREERGQGKIDLFWKGRLIVEMKSTGKDLSTNPGGAAHQAFKYVDHLDAEERPRWVLVSDFAHFVLYDLGEEVHEYLKGLSSARKTKPVVAAQFTLKEPTAQQRQEVENAAQAVLDARKPHIEAGATYSDLYDPIGMPAELWKAHQKLDQVVDRAYRQKAFASERERIEHLFGLYEKLTSPLAPTRRRR